jgi:hypothetical protein
MYEHDWLAERIEENRTHLGARCIVTLNTRDFPAGGEASGVRFLTPNAFLAEVESRHPDAHLGEHADQAGRQLP